MRFLMTALLGIICLNATGAGSNNLDGDGLDQEGRELRMAEYAVLMNQMIANNPRSRNLCQENQFACLAGYPYELGLALIAARNTVRSRTALVHLLKFSFDGGLSEDRACYIVNKGKVIRKVLLEVKPDALRAECEADVKKALVSHGDKFDGLSVDGVCTTPSHIGTEIAELVKAIDQRLPCP